MTEELVTLETAKLLKDKGFNWKCEHIIDRNKVITNKQTGILKMKIKSK